MQAAQKARARSRGYNLLSRIMAAGLTPDMLPTLRAVGTLGPALPDVYDGNAAAADHYAVFGRALFANQSFFTDASAQLGGEEVERVRSAYKVMGFASDASLEPDSLACELAALAHLCAAEADACRDGQVAAAERSRTLQATFLAAHLLRWLPPLCEALAQQPQALYAAVGALLASMVGDHAADLSADLAPLLPYAIAEPQSAPDPAAAETRLAEIVAWLLAPASAGFVLTHRDIHRAATAALLHTAFGDRRATLIQLLRAAGEHDALPPLLEALALRATQARAAYAEMAAANPALAPWVRTCDAHAVDTLALLAAMRAAGT